MSTLFTPNQEILAQAVQMGYSVGKVRDLATLMGLNVEAVVYRFARDYVEYKFRVAF
jgi:hypothetical protein